MPDNIIFKIKKELKKYSHPNKAIIYQRYFKTSKGQYAEGDVFIGVTVPFSRKVALKYKNISLSNILRILKSDIHEERFVALLILIDRYQKSPLKDKQKIVGLYLKNTKYINNWDLVDCSAYKIVGDFLFNHPNIIIQHKGKSFYGKRLLFELAQSKLLWDRRISAISTFFYISKNSLDPTFEIAKILMPDKHDLIHKGVGWMLREAGKKDKVKLENFLKTNISSLPRTTLRYAIEKFSEREKFWYLQLKK